MKYFTKTLLIRLLFSKKMQEKKEILNVFFKVGIVQILPIFIVLIYFIIMFIAINLLILDYGLVSFPKDKRLLSFIGLWTISIVLFSGLAGFIIASFQFIKNENDFQRLSTGIKYLNWAWLILCLLIAIIFSILLIQIIFELF